MTPRLGLVVHPSRDISAPLGELTEWAAVHGAEIGQLALGQTRNVAEPVAAADCGLLVSIGGDGTMLATIRAGMVADRPVLGVACGSLGVLTRVAQGDVGEALDRFWAGDWVPRELPGLEILRDGSPPILALNDIAIVRAGVGQIRVAAHIDGVLAGRVAGDGLIVATPLGSSAYSLASGGPLLGLDSTGYVLTPLPTHGGGMPPMVVGPRARVTLDVWRGFGGARLEIDGQIDTTPPARLELALRPAVAKVVAFADDEPLLSVLRRRGIVTDSPRIVLDEQRAAGGTAV